MTESEELTRLRQEQEAARMVYANIEAWLLEHAVKVETHDWAHFKGALASGFRGYAKQLGLLAAGTPPFIKRIDELRRRIRELEAEVAELRAKGVTDATRTA